MLLFAFAGCASSEEDEDLGAYIAMYIADPVYNFDPAYAYGNESALKIVSLLYENLFILGENGKPEKSLVKDYKIDKEENTMLITMRDDTFWSDGTAVSANDVVFAWQRILDSSKSFEAAALLYDIKNARACKEGDVPSIDDVGVAALNKTELEIEFEEGVNYDNFLLKLTSYALAPLRSDIIGRTEKEIDWAKSSTTMVTSGPFRVRSVSYDPETAGLILERNSYYQRDFMKDKVDVSVKPYRLVIDYTLSGAEILSGYENGTLFYIGELPMDVRTTYSLEEWEKKADVSDALSTHSYLFNEKAIIRKYNEADFKKLSGSGTVYPEGEVVGDAIFSKPEVRKALSLAINRTDIAKAVVFAEAANGLVPNGVYETTDKKKTFRDNDSTGLALTADLTAAKNLLTSAGVKASDYMFAISVPAYDSVSLEIAKMVQAAWGTSGLGFHVAINAISTVDNQDKVLSTGSVIAGVKDDIFWENYYAGKYEVVAFDYTALSVDPFSVLAPFAKGYTGGASVLPNSADFNVAVHNCGYDSKDYNAKIQAAFDEKDLAKRAKLLHEAEDILMKDLPIVPVVFNKTITMKHKDLSKVKYDFLQNPIFTKAKLKNYEDYIPAEEE